MHGVVITAYRDFPQLASLLRALPDARVHVHLDRNAAFTQAQRRFLESLAHVVVASTYRVSWGGISHLRAIIDGVESLTQEPAIETIHILSGQDYPCRPLSTYSEIRDPHRAYFSLTAVTDQPELLRRFRTRFEFPDQDLRDPAVRAGDALSIDRQERSGNVRTTLGSMQRLYKGMVWGSLPADMARYCVKVARTDRAFMDDLVHSRIPEEFFFQTVLMNSPLAPRVSPNATTFMLWTPGRAVNSGPAVLNIGDLDQILASDKVFVRKVDSTDSAELVAALADRIGASPWSPPVERRFALWRFVAGRARR